MSTVLVSIVMPVYNVANYLAECIDSVLAQSLQDWELIVVNDGSTDSSLSIIEDYVARDKRVRVISKVNEGYGKAINTGFDAARGEYIGIVESDDIIEPKMYERLYQLAKEHDADMVKGCHNNFWMQADGSRYYELGGTCPRDLEVKCIKPLEHPETFLIPLFIWQGLYKRSWFEHWNIRANETPGASYQDNGVWFQTMCYADRAVWTNEPIYWYRKTNMTSSIHKKGDYDIAIKEFDFIADTINEKAADRWKQSQLPYAVTWWSAMYYTYMRVGKSYHPALLNLLSKRMESFYLAGYYTDNELQTYREKQFLATMLQAKNYSDTKRARLVHFREWKLNFKQKLKKWLGKF